MTIILFKSLIVFGALHLTFLGWYLGALGLIAEYPVTMLWVIGLIVCVGADVFKSIYNNITITIEFEDLIFFSIILLIYLIMTIYYIKFGDKLDFNGASIFSINSIFVFNYVSYYMLGRFCFREVIYDKKILLVGYILLLLCVFLNTNYGDYKIRMDFIDIRKAGLYLILGDLFAVSSILVLCVMSNQGSKILIAFISVGALFFLNSRASMYSYIVATALYFLKSKNTINKLYLILVMFGYSLTLIFLGAEAFIANERMVIGFNNISDDGSFSDRAELFDIGLTQIYNNIIFGDYGGTVRDIGFIGSYIHNILSYWQQFGFLVFIAVVFLVGNSFIVCVRKLSSSDGDAADAEPLFFLGLFVVLMVIFARSYSWYLVWAFVGYFVTMKKNMMISSRHFKF